MSDIAKLQTGIEGLDGLLLGGIPEGRATLVTGRSGTGKTVLGIQVAANLARHGIQTVVVAVEETPADLIASGDALSLGMSELVSSRKLLFADVSRLDGVTLISGDYDVAGLTHRIAALVEQSGARAVVLDSATALFSPRPPQDMLRSQFFQLVTSFRELRLTSVILAEAEQDYGQMTTLGVEDYVCDLTVILRNIVDGARRRRTIEINKYRRSSHYKGEYPCTVTPQGLAVFPIDSGETTKPVTTVERFSSGVAGLDEMTLGGWLRNSIIIVRGPTGSGKTMLAGLYARAGAQRKERVVYYGFEESYAILLRNYREIGMDMQPAIDSGLLRVICRYAEATSLEDLLVDLRFELEDLRPSLVVIDSISSIEHSSSDKGFRQFMVGLASILREHGRTALLTQTVGQPGAEGSAPYLSTIADAILTLDYSVGFELNREMRVIKTRGSGHASNPYRLTIQPGGLVVAPMPRKEQKERSLQDRRAERRADAN
jgi:circadian clock protein KaiC